MNPEPLSFLSSLVGGRARPRRPFSDPFSSPVPSWGNIPEADSEAVPMAPLRRLRSCFFDDGPRSEIREGDLANIRRKYLIHPSVGVRSPTEFERAPDGGVGEVTIYEAYLEAGFRGVIPFLIDEVSSSFDGFYHLRSRDGAPLVEEPSRGVRGNHPFGDGWNSRCVSPGFLRWRSSGEAYNGNSSAIPLGDLSGNVTRSPASVVFDEYQKVKARKRRLSYTLPPKLARAALSAGGPSSISSTSAEIMPNRDLLADAYRRLTSEALLLRGQVQDMMACWDLLIQQVRASARLELKKEWMEKRVDHWNPEEEYRRHLILSGVFDHRSEDLSQAATPRSVIGLHEDPGITGDGCTKALLGSLDRVWDPEESGDSLIRSGDPGWNPEVSVVGPGGYMRIHSFSLRSGDRIGTLVYLDPEAFEAMLEPRGLDPEIAWLEPGGTVLRLPRQDYYRYLFGFRIMPLGSWPLSSSYAVFYFCRMSLTGLEGACVGVMTQVPGLRCFPRLEKQDLDCSLYFTVLLK
ncbi:hypothetical protein DY000_02052562 [Brassica cretica]|uniref:Uncharacterized protein n=1 Tax=Brassica cretica TaxID=69181 RepID=A0ABQ7AMK0_BRACR|nr:hypothetical protein DY000_02052562 [Brassica cretica]